ncbi:NlpC/P60 family protein [Rhodoligotrophos defluvii]|uniref:NlpC/P60 family protein n=1 Tax=Rhodoligotrophos defluvii TaxID=2561934 RepID=UPI0010CA190D|nr:NlpC/P60 family protein [Rhodoligotrophos defluvii]
MPISTAAAISPASEAVIAAARAWLGTPYRHQASLKGIGCDCIGLVRGVWRDLGGQPPVALPAYAPDWAETGGRELLLDGLARHLASVPVDECRAAAVVAFRWREGAVAKHAGILTASDRMIHIHQGITVSEVHLNPWWRKRLAGAYLYTL